MTLKTRRTLLALCCIMFLATGIVVLFYSQGYILDENFGLSQGGGLYVATPFGGSEIFINNKKEETTGMFNNGFFKSNLKIGSYSVLVAKENFWPWAKKLEVKEGIVTEAQAIMVPENPKGEIILKGKFWGFWSSTQQEILVLKEKKDGVFSLTFYRPDQNLFLSADSGSTAYFLKFSNEITNIKWGKNFLLFESEKGTIKASFNLTENSVSATYFSETTETISKYEKYSPKKEQKIWWDSNTNQVFVDWLKENSKPPYYICDTDSCELPLQIFQGKFPIGNVDFFPDRKDAIIMAAGNGVYALEIDGRGGRLIYPIYKGKQPFFALSNNNNYIYILDDGSLMKVYLE